MDETSQIPTHISSRESGGGALNNVCHGSLAGVSRNGNAVLTNPHVLIVYADLEYAGKPADQQVQELLASDFVAGLTQYGVIDAAFDGSAVVQAAVLPNQVLVDSSIQNLLKGLFSAGTVKPPGPAVTGNPVYLVICPSSSVLVYGGYSSAALSPAQLTQAQQLLGLANPPNLQTGLGGYHGAMYYGTGPYPLNVVYAVIAAPWRMTLIEHELVEAFTDFDGQNGYRNSSCEIGDICEALPTVGYAGSQVETYWSNSDRDCIAGPAWQTLGGGVTSGPAAVSWGPGRIDLFVAGSGSALYHQAFDGQWLGWDLRGTPAPGVGVASDPVAVSWAASRLDAFVAGTDGNLWHLWWQGAWGPWDNLLGGFTQTPWRPAAVAPSPGVLHLFVTGAGGSLQHKWFASNNWNNWETFGTGFASDPATVAWSPNRLDIFGVGADGHLAHVWWDGDVHSNGQESLLPSVQLYPGYSPAAISQGPGLLDIFVIDVASKLWHVSYDNGWTSKSLGAAEFFSRPCAVFSPAEPALPQPAGLAVVAVGKGPLLSYMTSPDGTSWRQGRSLGGLITGNPSVVCAESGRAEIFGAFKSRISSHNLPDIRTKTVSIVGIA